MSTRYPLSNPQPHPSDEELRMVYQQLCTSYQNIAEFRSKLLALLPFVTASSFVATMIGDPSKSLPLARLVLPFGLFGALVTLALFLYEVDNLKRSTLLTAQGRTLEKAMHLLGPFTPGPSSLFNTRNAAGLIYSTTFAGWICLALWFALPGTAIYVSLLVFVISVLLSLPFLQRLRLQVSKDFQVGGASEFSLQPHR
jgi:hypothetical protein